MSQRRPLQRWELLVCSFVAGSSARTVTSPLDVAKIIIAVHKGAKSIWATEPVKDALLKENPFLFWFKGNGTAVWRLIPFLVTRMWAMQSSTMNTLFPNHNVVGVLAGMIAVFVTHPFDTIKNRLTVQPWRDYYHGTWTGMARVVQEEGVSGLYGGVLPAVLAVVPYEGGAMLLYNWLSKRFNRDRKNRLVDFAIWVGSNFIAQTASYPLDLIKKRMQIQSTLFPAGHQFAYTSAWDGLAEIVRTEGVSGVFKGAVQNHLKIVPFTVVQRVVSYQMERLLLDLSARSETERKTFWGSVLVAAGALFIASSVTFRLL